MALFEIKGLTAGYGNVPVISEIHLDVEEGETVALLGRNGVGKTTLLRSALGYLGRPMMGTVCFEGNNLIGASPFRIARLKIGFAPENRGVFRELTLKENIDLATYRSAPQPGMVEKIFSVIPELKNRWSEKVHNLSGGEQQMVSISRALLAKPRLLILDEFSEGLSELVLKRLVELISFFREETGMAVLMVDQRIDLALSMSDRCYVMDHQEGLGRIVESCTSTEMREDESALVRHLSVHA